MALWICLSQANKVTEVVVGKQMLAEADESPYPQIQRTQPIVSGDGVQRVQSASSLLSQNVGVVPCFSHLRVIILPHARRVISVNYFSMTMLLSPSGYSSMSPQASLQIGERNLLGCIGSILE